jgi:hypothetical protein
MELSRRAAPFAGPLFPEMGQERVTERQLVEDPPPFWRLRPSKLGVLPALCLGDRVRFRNAAGGEGGGTCFRLYFRMTHKFDAVHHDRQTASPFGLGISSRLTFQPKPVNSIV